jgi:glycosyltransferase involved in cell wall biosynthesis
VGIYCEELLNAMLAVNHEDQFFVFSHRPLPTKFPSANGNLNVTDDLHFPVRAFYLHVLLPKLLERIRPDICHYTNFLAPISESRPYVVTIHDMGLEVLRHAHPFAKRIYTKRLIPCTARKARLIITNSEYSKWEIVRHLGISEDRIRVTPLAASPGFRPQDVVPQVPYFLYVGNLEPRKNVERLIEAFARMPRRDHQLIIVGDRWYQGSAAEEKARSLGLNGRVKFLGYVPRSDLPGLFSGATALIYPSLLEGFGLPIVEAMACGTPVITSNNSSMREVAGEAALLIDPRSVTEITEAMVRVVEDASLRAELSAKGLKRSAEFSWEKTAKLTMEAYAEAAYKMCVSDPLPPALRGAALPLKRGRIDLPEQPQLRAQLRASIYKTIEYAKLFQYPLTPDEVHDRLFDVEVDETTFQHVLESLHLEPDPDLLNTRANRERISDTAIRDVRPHLETLASIPFLRMIAFSGATAHRNMTSLDDVDLFIIIEDGKLWAVFLCAMIWAKFKGLRKRLCMNYLLSDAALPLPDTDIFTAQQVASLKPIFGRAIYDRFLENNPFVRARFPNLNVKRHREMYPEIQTGRLKLLLEGVLRLGSIQFLECFSRLILSRYLDRKRSPNSELYLDARHLKLHLTGHRAAILDKV